MPKQADISEYEKGKRMLALQLLHTLYAQLPESEQAKATAVRHYSEAQVQVAELFRLTGVGWDESDQALYLPDAIDRNASTLLENLERLVRAAEGWIKNNRYNDAELQQLATTSSGRGEISPDHAANIIATKAALEAFKGCFDEAG